MYLFSIQVVTIVSFLLIASECVKLSLIKKKYFKGVKAYKDERWSECIAQFEDSIHLYKLYKTHLVNCRFQCNRKQYESQIKLNIEDLKMYELLLNKKNCLRECFNKSLEDTHLEGDNGDIIPTMQARKPFEYIHLCYFQMNALPKAASAAYTYLVGHPNDETMLSNVEYYSKQPEVDPNEIDDMLIEDFMKYYRDAKDAYYLNDWEKSITNFEAAIRDYILVENNCRMECELLPDQQTSPEFIITMTNYIASLLYCEQQCQDKLKILNYQSGIEYLADVLNHLQMSYYNSKNLEEAAKAVSSYLVMMPNDEDMKSNKEIYKTVVDEKAFVNRSDIIYYFNRDNYEKMLLNVFNNHNMIMEPLITTKQESETKTKTEL